MRDQPKAEIVSTLKDRYGCRWFMTEDGLYGDEMLMMATPDFPLFVQWINSENDRLKPKPTGNDDLADLLK